MINTKLFYKFKEYIYATLREWNQGFTRYVTKKTSSHNEVSGCSVWIKIFDNVKIYSK